MERTDSFEWKQDGNCRGTDPNLFYSYEKEDVKIALGVCAVCPVLEECLEYAIENQERHGIWGGTKEGDRTKMIKQRTKQAS